jgi:hypothetical protein
VVRVSEDVIAALDRLANRTRAMPPWAPVSRSEMARRAMQVALESERVVEERRR